MMLDKSAFVLSFALLTACDQRPMEQANSVCPEVLSSHDCAGRGICRVPMQAVLALPACFEGLEVQIAGYVAHSGNRTILFTGADDAKGFALTSSIRLIPAAQPASSVFSGPDRFLFVTGEFRRSGDFAPNLGTDRGYAGVGTLLVTRPGMQPGRE